MYKRNVSAVHFRINDRSGNATRRETPDNLPTPLILFCPRGVFARAKVSRGVVYINPVCTVIRYDEYRGVAGRARAAVSPEYRIEPSFSVYLSAASSFIFQPTLNVTARNNPSLHVHGEYACVTLAWDRSVLWFNSMIYFSNLYDCTDNILFYSCLK